MGVCFSSLPGAYRARRNRRSILAYVSFIRARRSPGIPVEWTSIADGQRGMDRDDEWGGNGKKAQGGVRGQAEPAFDTRVARDQFAFSLLVVPWLGVLEHRV